MKSITAATVAATLISAALAAQVPFRLAAPSGGEQNPPTYHLSPSGLHHNSAPGSLPPTLTLHFDPSSIDALGPQPRLVFSAVQPRLRNWEDVTKRCGRQGGVESCEADDVHAIPAPEAGGDSASCTASQVKPDGRVFFEACEPARALLEAMTGQDGEESGKEGRLMSTAVALELKGERVGSWWIAHLSTPRAAWPLRGAAHSGDGGKDQDGALTNRIAGVMEDPFIAKAAKTKADTKLQGVDLRWSRWNQGLSIRIPAPQGNTTHRAASPSDAPESLLAPVHAPLGGQVVWIGNYTRAMPPKGGRNDEHGSCILIRDQWSFVVHLCGPLTSLVSVGDYVSRGSLVAHASRRPLSREPPSHRRPADPPKSTDAPPGREKRYPFRFAQLRVAFARPDAGWTEWKSPDDAGWVFYNPLHALLESKPASPIPPYASPTQLFFARPSLFLHNGSEPIVFATSTDLFKPTLSGKVEMIAGFQAFMPTPGDAEDGLDGLSLYSLHYAVWRELDQGPWLGGCALPQNVSWRTSFERRSLPSNHTALASLLTAYVPAFRAGRFFPTKYASQFDEKSRRLFYALTRTALGAPNLAGTWDTTRERDGDNVIVVRAATYFGDVADCSLGARVRIANFGGMAAERRE